MSHVCDVDFHPMTKTPHQSTDSLSALSAVKACTFLRNGEITAENYAAALLAECDAFDHLNAFISFDQQRILEAARQADKRRASGAELGPLHGLPIPVKDSVNTKDFPTTGGTAALKNFRPGEDAKLISQLKAAGAFVMGKTKTEEHNESN